MSYRKKNKKVFSNLYQKPKRLSPNKGSFFLYLKGEKIMSYLYDQYLTNHKSNVKKGFDWIRDNLPELMNQEFDLEHQMCFAHDHSKTEKDEYDAYDAYFYGGNKSYSVVQDFNKAWLLHIHRNPHHWQYWILINDNPEEGEILIEMSYNYILEMICDWWAFSWSKGNLNEIFPWYEQRKNYIKLHPNSRDTVEFILNQLKIKLKGDANGF
ncbi:MAG: DUF5662 family protein [Fermentimonas sp.]|nr:DUF5662 family protein [Fermentimonas sp.]